MCMHRSSHIERCWSIYWLIQMPVNYLVCIGIELKADRMLLYFQFKMNTNENSNNITWHKEFWVYAGIMISLCWLRESDLIFILDIIDSWKEFNFIHSFLLICSKVKHKIIIFSDIYEWCMKDNMNHIYFFIVFSKEPDSIFMQINMGHISKVKKINWKKMIENKYLRLPCFNKFWKISTNKRLCTFFS